MVIKPGRCLLSDLLKKRRMQQYELATRANISPTAVSEYVNGRVFMSYITAVKIAYVLNCHAEDLYEWVIDQRVKE